MLYMNELNIKTLALVVWTGAVLGGCASQQNVPESGSVVVSHLPVEGERLSAEYTVEVNGHSVPVYTAGLSEDSLEAPLHLDAYYSFADFECAGAVDVVIRSAEPLSELTVRAVGRALPVELDGNTATFRLETNGNFLIERNGNGRKDPLLLFANPLDRNPPTQGDPNVVYFGPGWHDAGLITLTDNQTLYIAGGAIVTGRVEASGDNIRILGRGMLENSTEAHNWKNIVLLNECTNARVEGITIRKNTRGWTLVTKECDGLVISNVKICGSHSYNDDGIDLCNTRNARVEGCFVRTNDDCFAFKGINEAQRTNCENIVVTDCMMWSNLCTTVLLGDESHANYMRNIVFEDCFVPYLSYEKYPKKFLMLHACEAMRMENIRIENVEIRGEGQDRNYIEIAAEFNQWCQTETAGHIRNVLLKNIQLTGDEGGYYVVIKGFDATHLVENLRFEDCTINGTALARDAARVEIGDFTKNISFHSSH